MKALFIPMGLVIFISCNGEDGSRSYRSPDTAHTERESIIPEVEVPTVDTVSFVERLIQIKVFADGHIAYKQDTDSTFSNISKDQLLPTVDQYPNNRIQVIQGKNTSDDKVREVMKIIGAKRKTMYFSKEEVLEKLTN